MPLPIARVIGSSWPFHVVILLVRPNYRELAWAGMIGGMRDRFVRIIHAELAEIELG